MNKEYLANLDNIRNILKKTGLISLKDFFEEFPELSNSQDSYQPADHRYKEYDVKLDQLSLDFIENITNKKFVELQAFGYGHKDFELRKFFDKEGYFFLANISKKEFEGVGGEVFVVSDEDPLQFPASTNTITIIKVTKEDESFVSYVNHKIKDGMFIYVMGMLV